MPDYEILILNKDGNPAAFIETQQVGDEDAIRSAMRIANGINRLNRGLWTGRAGQLPAQIVDLFAEIFHASIVGRPCPPACPRHPWRWEPRPPRTRQ